MSAHAAEACRKGHPRSPETTWTGVRHHVVKATGAVVEYAIRVCRLCRRKPHDAIATIDVNNRLYLDEERRRRA